MQRLPTFMAGSLVLVASLCSTQAGAAPAASARIQVTGSIRPPACGIVLEGGGEVDFGNIAVLSIPENQTLRLPLKKIPIRLECSDAARMHLKVRDERAGSVPPAMLTPADEPYLFGLGLAAGTKLGAFKIALSANSFQGYRSVGGAVQDLSVIYSFDNSGWSAASGGHFRSNGHTRMSFAPRGTIVAGAYVMVNGELEVQAWVNKRSTLPGGMRLELAGSVMLELFYN